MSGGPQFGPYVCLRRLGGGGMADTFLAHRRGEGGFEQRVCIKVMRSQMRRDAEARRLFEREAALAAMLRHGNIVSVVDVVADGEALVLELVDGVDLATLVQAMPGRKLPHHVAIYVVRELCKALEYAHTRTLRGEPHGIVHRDISLANVLISYAGEVKLADFGIARAIASPVEPASMIKGKLSYMAPEQAAGDEVDGRTDLFSLGVVFYELLSGQRPLVGQGQAALLRNLLDGVYRPLCEVAPMVPSGVELVVHRMLAREPEGRIQTATEVFDALEAFSPQGNTYRQLAELAELAKPQRTPFIDDAAEQVDRNETRSATQVTGTLPMASHSVGRTESVDAGAEIDPAMASSRQLRLIWFMWPMAAILLLFVLWSR